VDDSCQTGGPARITGKDCDATRAGWLTIGAKADLGKFLSVRVSSLNCHPLFTFQPSIIF
jgi:hypothetical protein